MPNIRSAVGLFILLLLTSPTVGLSQEEEQGEHPAGAMMRRGHERMEAMRHASSHRETMRRIAAYAPPHLLQRQEVLGLTEKQLSHLEALAEELKVAHEKAGAETKAHQDQLLEVWQAAQPNVSQLRAHAEAAMESEHAAHLAMLSAAAQAKGLLTPEQRGRVEGWMDARHIMPRRGMREHSMPGRRIHRKEPVHPRPEGS